MNYIFYFLIVISIVAGAVNGKLDDVVNAILTGAELSVKVAFSLIGIMAFWLGIMKIAEKCGLVAFIAKLLKPISKRLFNELPEDSPAIADVAMSFSANALGLANAFLAMSTAGFQLIPATVIAILIGIGYKKPTEIIAPTLLVTTIAFVSAVIIAKIFQQFWAPQKAINTSTSETRGED